MSTIQDVINAACLVIGGTQPDPTNTPWLYSGYIKNDGTGVSGVHGAFSAAPGAVLDPPAALVIPDSFTVGEAPMQDVLVQGREFNLDRLRVLLLVQNNDSRTEWAILNPFRDSVPAALRAHVQLNPTVNPGLYINQAWISSGKTGVFEWGGTQFIGWEFVLTVQRFLPATYTA